MAVKTIDSVRGDDQLVASTYQESGDDTIGRASGLAASSAYCATQHRGFNATNGEREDGETRFSGLARYTRVSKRQCLPVRNLCVSILAILLWLLVIWSCMSKAARVFF